MQEIEEGSGYGGPSTIMPTRPTDAYRTRFPEQSPVYPVGPTPYDGDDDDGDDSMVVVTDRINRKPHIQKKLRKYAVVAGRLARYDELN